MTIDSDLEEVPCPLCESGERETAYAVFRPFAVVRCMACGFYYLSPRLTESAMLRRYRDDAYFASTEGGYERYVEQEEALRATFRRFMTRLGELGIVGGSLLEVGCGYGYLLQEAEDSFTFRAGTEFSRQAVEETRRKADVIYEGGIDQIPAGENFDCIIATQVIEHVYRPKHFIQQLCAHLRPGGKMVIATPHMGSFWRHLMGRRWPSFKIPEHVLYFDRRNLSALLTGSGLVRLQSIPYPHAFPISLIAAKFHLRLPDSFGQNYLWLPATTIAICGYKPHG